MNSQPHFFRKQRRLTALAATLALHVLLVLSWQFAGKHPDTASDDASRIQWVNVTPVKRPAPPVSVATGPAPTVTKAARNARRAAAAPVAVTQAKAAPPPPAAESPADAPEQVVAETRPTPSTDDMLRQARKDLVGIDKDLKKEFPGPLIKAPRNTPQSRLEQGIDLAYELAPPKWYEQAKIKELTVPGGSGERRYRITTAAGTYCLTYPSNHSLISYIMQQQGLGSRQSAIKPQKTMCPIEF